MFAPNDVRYMKQALVLADRGRYTTDPNPRVGCIIVKAGRVIGCGWHQRAGQPHAEINALNALSDSAEGATAYVTLEPCSHFGRTPPCCDALVESGVNRVVVAMDDPNPASTPSLPTPPPRSAPDGIVSVSSRTRSSERSRRSA